jgi:hypothetical protein
MGHDDMVMRKAGRIWLQCQHCGRGTVGWNIGGAATEPSLRRARHRIAPLFVSLERGVFSATRHR